MQKTETNLGVSERVIKTIALIKHEEAEARAARGYHADDELITPDTVTATPSTMTIKYFDDGARDNFPVGVATGLSVPRSGVRITGTRSGSIILGTSATIDGDAKTTPEFASSFTDLAKSWGLRFRPYAVSGVRVEEPAAALAPAEAAPVEAPAEPAPPPTPAMADYSPLRSTVVVLHDDDDNRYPEEEIEGRDVRVKEHAAAEVAPEEAPAEPAPPPTPAMADYSPLRSTVVVLHDDDDNRYPEEEIEGRDVRVKEHAAAEVVPEEAPAEPAPPPTPAMADHSPLRSTVVVLHDDDDNRYPEEEIEGCDVRVEEPAAAPAEAAPEEVLADPAPQAIELQTQALGIQTQALADADADADGWATGLDDDTADDGDNSAAAAEDDDGALSRLRRGGFDLAANALHVQQCALSKQMRAAAQPQQHLTAARSHGGAGGARGGGAWDGVDGSVEHGDWGEAGDDDDGGAAAANDTSRSRWSRSAQAIQRAPPSHAREIDGRIEAAINAINQTPAPGMTDYIPLQTIGVVFYDNDDDRHLEEEIEGRDGGLRDHAVADDDGELEEEEAMGRSHFLGEELDDDEDKTVRQDYWAAPSGSSGASGAAASATVGLGQLWRMIDGIDGGFHTERSVDTSVLTLREESPSPPEPNDASATGRTYDDITKPPPPHLRCVVSPLSSLPPVVRCTAASRHLFAAEFPVRRDQAVLFARLPLDCLVLDV